MSALLEVGRRQGFSPGFTARINQNHPLAQGIATWVRPGVPYDLARRKAVTIVGSPTLIGSPWGPAWNHTGSSALSVANLLNGSTSSEITVALLVQGGSGTTVLCESSANYNSNYGAFIVYVNSGPVQAAVKGASQSPWNTTTSFATAQWRMIGFSAGLATATEMKGYVDGCEDGSMGTTTTVTAYTDQTLYIASRAGTSIFHTGGIADVIVWNRRLHAGEWASLWRSPAQMLETNEPRRFFYFYESPSRTGAAAATLEAFTSSASGTRTVPVFTGTAAVTLAALTSSAAGTFTPAATSATLTYEKSSIRVSYGRTTQ